MNRSISHLAQKYACAYYNLYGPQITHQDYEAFKQLSIALHKNTDALALLTAPLLQEQQQRALLSKFTDTYNVPATFHRLLALLTAQHRIALLPDIARHIIHIYQEAHNIVACTITSSIALTHEQLQTLKDFIHARTHATIEATPCIDSRLIAGIRIQSDTLLWEYSVAQQLRSIAKAEKN